MPGLADLFSLFILTTDILIITDAIGLAGPLNFIALDRCYCRSLRTYIFVLAPDIIN